MCVHAEHVGVMCVNVVLKFSSCMESLMQLLLTVQELRGMLDLINTHSIFANATPLSTAATDCVGYLLRKGASVDVQDKVGITALHLAARNG